MQKEYRFGLDVGIGSVGWAVLGRQGQNGYIEDLGVRIFESGELERGKSRKSQERRRFRAGRRLTRRRYYRKERLKRHLEKIGLFTVEQLKEYYANTKEDIYALRSRAARMAVKPAELVACLIHICNHRGYHDFYEDESTVNVSTLASEPAAVGTREKTKRVDEESEQAKEEGENQKAAQTFDALYRESGCRTVGEYISRYCRTADNLFLRVRNRETKDERILIRRKYLRQEVQCLLNQQKQHYAALTPVACEMITNIIFAQRDFEDGPGDAQDCYRRYTNFLDSIGKCMYYKELQRGFRCTVISDVYAVVNALSQYRFFNSVTGDFSLPSAACEALLEQLLTQASLNITVVKKVLAQYHIQLLNENDLEREPLSKAVKYIKVMKRCMEESDVSWQSFIEEEQFDIARFSRLHQISQVLASCQTPSRRRRALEKLGFLSAELIERLIRLKLGGTSRVSYRYMCEAIAAFRQGDLYGNFQAERLKARAAGSTTKAVLFTTALQDEDIKTNPVVHRAVNETRKVLKALIQRYGIPTAINIEVASDLSRCFSERQRIEREQKKREADKAKDIQCIATMLQIAPEEVRGRQLERYHLYREQGGKCLYSGKELGSLVNVLRDASHMYEIDHIVPYSLILDNTLHNKALVYGSENQLKRQRTPLMYLTGEEATAFHGRVNEMYRRREGGISQRKYQYLMLGDIYGEQAEEVLGAWKSRNIHDTRYISKYLVNYCKVQLGQEKVDIHGIRGGITSKFRKLWLNRATWGNKDKQRDNYLHHAVDAIVLANLTPAYIEIASDNIKLQQIFRSRGRIRTAEYDEYLERCVQKMKRYYHFTETYTRPLLEKTERIPAFVHNLRDEVDIRCNTEESDLFGNQMASFYGERISFVLPPQMPLVSHKPERRFRGMITDANPIKIREVEGEMYRISRMKIKNLTVEHIPRLCTKDYSLIRHLTELLQGKDKKYTLGKYLTEAGLPNFMYNGQIMHKVSIRSDKVISNYYAKRIDELNYSVLGGIKYYCVEVYKNQKGKTCIRGIRFVDVIKRDKKLYVKEETRPVDYHQHLLYLFTNDYIVIETSKKQIKFSGYYCAVKNINRNLLFCVNDTAPQSDKALVSITQSDRVRKFEVDILGRRGGEVRCSEPLSWEVAKK